MLLKTLIVFSSLSFIFYSFRAFFSKTMINEYSRWGLSKMRIIIGFFQFSGGVGLILGIYNLNLLLLTSFLLTIMMFVAVLVRIKLKDSLLVSIPAIFYLILNFTIFYIAMFRM